MVEIMPPRPIYYDTETTGIRADKERIIEIAAYDPSTERSFCKFINPGCPIPAESTRITSITDEMVAGAPGFDIIGKEFIEFCGSNAILIAHNNDKFDKIFLETESLRADLQLPSWRYVDTLKWSRKYRPDLPSHALQALRDAYGIPLNQAHRAMDDVMTLYKIFSVMIDDLDIETVHSLLYQPHTVHRMPFGKHQGKPFAEVPRHYLEWLKNSGALDKEENKELREALSEKGFLTYT